MCWHNWRRTGHVSDVNQSTGIGATISLHWSACSGGRSAGGSGRWGSAAGTTKRDSGDLRPGLVILAQCDFSKFRRNILLARRICYFLLIFEKSAPAALGIRALLIFRRSPRSEQYLRSACKASPSDHVFGRACHCGRGSFGPPPRRPLVTGAPVISRVSLNVNGAVREIESRRAPLCFLGFEDSAGPGPAAGAALIYSDTTGELFWDATGGTSDDQILIATLTGSPTLVSADILLNIATRSNR